MTASTITRTPVGNFITNLQSRLSGVYYNIEVNRKIIIPSNVRQLIEGVIIESITNRPDEWMQQHQLDCTDSTDLQSIIPIVADTVSGILYRTAPEPNQDQLSLIGVLEVISRNWCGVFPFCRS